jgi:hypothetical protein
MCRRVKRAEATTVVSDEALVGSWKPLNGRKEIDFVWQFLPFRPTIDCELIFCGWRGAIVLYLDLLQKARKFPPD